MYISLFSILSSLEEDLHEYSEQQEKEEEIKLEMETKEAEKAGSPDAHEQYPGAG